MVDYNPSKPIILGQEWVPIRNEYVTFGENQTAGNEIGTTFTLTASTQVNNARFYMDDFVYGRFVNEGVTAAIYTTGTEDQTGPIQKVTIPCTSGSITGGITFNTPATDVPTALQNPGTTRQSGLSFNGTAGFTAFRAQFGVMQNTYAQALAGKRIVGVSLVSQVIIDSSLTVNNLLPISSTLDETIELGITRISSVATFSEWGLLPVMELEAGNDFTIPARNTDVTRNDKLGNFSLYGGSLISTSSTYPWTYEELTKFDSAFGASSICAQVNSNNLASNIPIVKFTYMALEVYFCEEKRLAYGTMVYNAGPVAVGSEVRYRNGANVVPLYSLTGSTNPVLPAGTYTLTVSQTDFGDNFDSTDKTNTSMNLNAIRELYTLPSFDTVEVDTPAVVDDAVLGTAFTTTEVVIVPQLSLHLSGGAPLTEVHPYGRQAVAQVYGNIYAQQELFDTPIGSAIDFPWVRFYARRWGDTTIPLTLTGQGGLAASTVSITPDEFDELPETLDGWKEVTLQFATAPSMGTLGTPTWRWTATGETNGNRWEILAAAAPAVSGVSGNLYNLAPATQQLYNATYYAPTGATQDLEWMPQGIASQWISGAGVSDDATDAFLIFAQMPPDVTGFSVTTLCQPLSGIGQECDIDPCCIPSSVAFNQITWSQVSTPASGFGYYEMQRMDTIEADWQTIMQGTSVSGTTFNDFEARIGIESSYRIRSVDLYGFEGEWSDTISATILEPGIEIGCPGGHILVFTSNERQGGDINLAYSSVWMGGQDVEEQFAFPEASFVQLQPMYNRDFFTAFRPTERGGEQFSRTVLVQAAAIDPETLGDFQSLRDMAWESVSYICVRDEDGNRWFATVGVPSGRVINSRRLYMAPVQIAEVTDTPSPVDPANDQVAGTVTSAVCAESFDCSEVVASDSFTRTETDTWGSTT